MASESKQSSDVEVSWAAVDERTQACTFRFRGLTPTMLSMVRHALMKDVSCLAFAAVDFLKCTASWEYELIAHRIGQIPVAAVDPSTGGGTDGHGAVFEARVKADDPTVSPCVYTIVKSTDFKLCRGSDGSAPTATIVHARSGLEAGVARGGFQVVTLLPGQEVHLRAIAERGTGREGTRWKCVHLTQVQGPPHVENVLRVETTGAVQAWDALHMALVATEHRLRRAAESLAVSRRA